jgi:hypothetical protein
MDCQAHIGLAREQIGPRLSITAHDLAQRYVAAVDHGFES